MKPVTPFDNYPSFGNAGSRSAPGDAKYALGFVAADTFPAEWANYFFHGATKGVSDLNTAVRSIWVELENILDAYGITADISEESQLLTAIGKIYPKITTCSTGASTQNKSLAISGNVLKAGDVYVITMDYGNTYGDGSLTYPTLSINSGTAYPICNASGDYLGAGDWSAGETIKVLFTGSRYLMATPGQVDKVENGNHRPVTSNAVSCIMASSTTITGPELGAGGNVKIMFTSNISGADTVTALSITYNGTSYTVKVCKEGGLVNIYPHNISSNLYYIQEYTTIEFVFDGTNFIVIGNPVVLSGGDYTVYADGKITYPIDSYIKSGSGTTITLIIDKPTDYIVPHPFILLGTIPDSGYAYINYDMFNVVKGDGSAFDSTSVHLSGNATVITSISAVSNDDRTVKVTIKLASNVSRYSITSLSGLKIH
jgi:hypothetical protein